MAEEITMQDIKIALSELVQSQQETDRQLKEVGIQLKETDKGVKDSSLTETTV